MTILYKYYYRKCKNMNFNFHKIQLIIYVNYNVLSGKLNRILLRSVHQSRLFCLRFNNQKYVFNAWYNSKGERVIMIATSLANSNGLTLRFASNPSCQTHRLISQLLPIVAFTVVPVKNVRFCKWQFSLTWSQQFYCHYFVQSPDMLLFSYIKNLN